MRCLLLLTAAAAGLAALTACSDLGPGVFADRGEDARVRLLTHAETLQSVQHAVHVTGGADTKADADGETPADPADTARDIARRNSGLED